VGTKEEWAGGNAWRSRGIVVGRWRFSGDTDTEWKQKKLMRCTQEAATLLSMRNDAAARLTLISFLAGEVKIGFV